MSVERWSNEFISNLSQEFPQFRHMFNLEEPTKPPTTEERASRRVESPQSKQVNNLSYLRDFLTP